MDPGPPAPQAGILDHSMQNYARIRRFCKLDDDPTDLDGESNAIWALVADITSFSF